jgi:hypothetical protein
VVTIYHNLNLTAAQEDTPKFRDLELAGIVFGTNDLDEAFDRTIHRDGENWTDDSVVEFFGDRRSRRSSREGDVFVLGDGTAYRVMTQGFQPLPNFTLPFLGDNTDKISVCP